MMRLGFFGFASLFWAVAAGASADDSGGAALPAPADIPAPTCPQQVFPEGQNWLSRAFEVEQTRGPAIRALQKAAFTLQGHDDERIGVRTDAVLIVSGGAVVYEQYGRGWDSAKRHLTWSVSKSLTNALVGVAVHQGLLRTTDSICTWIPDLPPASCAVHVEHLLEMASGFDWKETYENEGNQQSSVLALLYGQGSKDGARFTARHRLRDAPGTSWMYSSGDAVTLAAVVGAALRPTYGERFPWSALLGRIGAGHSTMERDAAGTYNGASFWYATTRDAARLGLLYLADGCWQQQRILPEGWVAEAAAVNPAFKKKRIAAQPSDVYGRLFWLNRAVPEAGIPKPMPDVPDDAFAAQGHWGQSVTIIPSLDLVIVRFADDRDGAFDFNHFLKLAIAVGRKP